ncbi:hypothetical protein O181_097357 [Austropuccinia psidii MF-1]|uniref:Uncharacterized protein n=1 Tax=Austropuccinia psidii MF-1 TaxID=1389203 RepID=A0A9Q3J943_9BASI|nr:hypothetical protein [Austropuccinia psidii MF-1]
MGSRLQDVERWTNTGGPIPVGARQIYSSSAVPIFRISKPGVVKQIRIISKSPNQAMHSIPINFQKVLSTIPSSISPPSSGSSTDRPSLALPMRPSLIAQSTLPSHFNLWQAPMKLEK